MTTLTGVTREVTHEAVELERRQGGGQRVRMLWIAAANQVLIEQTTFRDSGDTVTLRGPPKARVLYAFEYPERFDEVEVAYRYQVTAGQMPCHVA